ncbi:MAG TPA: hypothetical protein VNQ73_04045 [Ilumatobacter sp.]|nr:hypothetical protein [Ilumatobacter sp.]
MNWQTQPEATRYAEALLGHLLGASTRLAGWAARLTRHTSTQLFDWIDHLAVPALDTGALERVGYRPAEGPLWRHPGAQLPAIAGADGDVATVALRVDDADAFVASHGGSVTGSPLAALRSAEGWEDAGVRLAAVERRSWAAGVTPENIDGHAQAARAAAFAAWRDRDRSDAPGQLEATLELARHLASSVGADLAASYAMAVERDYWEQRNQAAQLQRARQDSLGLGWGNHDHHTFRSSREAFGTFVHVLEALGFQRRERFSAGAEAGWGAQVLEHPGAGIVVFADVDLLPDEIDTDFVDAPLAPAELGTVGMWCALHGESILSAGMHHLEGQFVFDAMRADLAARGVTHQTPFSELAYLRQAFTTPELWQVDDRRLRALVDAGAVDAPTAARFRRHGAPGSHLETLQRRDGFKGFNQTSVSATIRESDPRRLSHV